MFPKKILVATNASDEAYPAIEAAVELANGTGSELHLVFVVSPAPELPYPKFTAKGRNEAFWTRSGWADSGSWSSRQGAWKSSGEG